MPWWVFRRRRSVPASRATGRVVAEGAALPPLQGERRFLQEQPYMLPKDLGEVNRLDFQHYVLWALLRANYLAPIGQPRRILDVGCGTGQWAFELCQQFPQVEVVGVDLEQVKATTPPSNYRFVQGDVLRGLPFANASFDFVHQRLLTSALPLAAWPEIVRELARVTAPGGWVELVEPGLGLRVTPAGPANEKLLSMGTQLAAQRGLDMEGAVARSLERYLQEARLVNVHMRIVEAPVGEWGGRIGSLLALDLREIWKAISVPLAAHFNLSQQEVHNLIDSANQEWNSLHASCSFIICYGQKPFSPS
ncbi:MAG: class I SAM-dependent methyltransferase [Thermogemmatispora sp.]|uniref:class I SAM-dependent methyltransferase n=1 Tax=Thermogemmatispora sp. TaxID=1968838 RepID=UPI00262A1EAA|nr:class I SAM-dependent methyltransferase [Thermogemmatispora sp.]MBX5455729.1 class I SAM-dependent methyltransferase [Thermogemmatispora sp.]